ncbi:MAG: NADP-dependent 3-hydroxy acid dehydrogenase YdfG [Alphaproteobacteria bacterium MarineAlpha2_Bin1]|nr:MAG: NADP-dependent 3-hydroxy acid dehydrogenase YdfG [Alphaproteobacteria bacterium MarineAlpha2_Bin1]|tara:strand:+ start:28 stop:783 length:756 start_codon:yes stop_codon:yes gene_type:complete
MKNKIILITGSTSGFGEAISLRLAKKGARIIAAGRRLNKLLKLQKKFGLDNILPLELDVRDQKKVFEAINSLKKEWSDIDILINNAGLAKGLNSSDDTKMEHWNEMVDTNCKGLMYVTRAVLPTMSKKNKGHIINIGSVAGTYPYFGGNIYGASKAFVHHFSLNLRADLADKNIRVTSLEPGAAETEFSIVRFDGDKDKAKKTYDGFEPIEAENIAEIVEFVINSPKNINLNRIEVMANNQTFAGFKFIKN